MKNEIIREYFPLLFCCCLFITTACVNEIASEDIEIQGGNIPITFSVKIEKSATKVTGNTFDANDQIGLYALITGSTMADERYIDNLLLTCGKDQNLISERDVFLSGRRQYLGFHSLLSLQFRRGQRRTSHHPSQHTTQPGKSGRLFDQRLHDSFQTESFKIDKVGILGIQTSTN